MLNRIVIRQIKGKHCVILDGRLFSQHTSLFQAALVRDRIESQLDEEPPAPEPTVKPVRIQLRPKRKRKHPPVVYYPGPPPGPWPVRGTATKRGRERMRQWLLANPLSAAALGKGANQLLERLRQE
jgi:hypothetical protein